MLWRGVIAALMALVAAPAWAGAWPQAPGATQAILKYEGSTADRAYATGSHELGIPTRRDEAVSLYVEHGLTHRLTLQAQVGWTEGKDLFVDYSGRGPIALGLRYALIDRPNSVVSLYVGGVYDGVGRNAGYAAPGAGSSDLEVRLLAGRSGAIGGKPIYVDLQAARLLRRGLPNETRLDATLGYDFAPRWQALAQVYAGQAEANGADPRWLKGELSILRRFGGWSLQGGWRATLAGRATPIERGPVVAIWRTF